MGRHVNCPARTPKKGGAVEQDARRKTRDLLRRAQCGNAEAFAQLFRQSAQTVWRTALAILHDEHAASDAVQETALNAWRAIPRFKGECALETWLVRIAINASYDIKAKTRHEEPGDVREAEFNGNRVLAGRQRERDA